MKLYGNALLLGLLALAGGELAALQTFEQESRAVHSDAEPIRAALIDFDSAMEADEIESTESIQGEPELSAADNEAAAFLQQKEEEYKKTLNLSDEQKKKSLAI
jgi:hypothetical protein